MEEKQNSLALIMTVALLALSLLAAHVVVPDVLYRSEWLKFGLISLVVFLVTEGIFLLLTPRKKKDV